jgi:hypothetical protein
MTGDFILQGRHLCAADVAWIQALIASHPRWHRTALSREICRCWEWKDETGRIKDMACRTMLLKLERRGLVQLPERRGPSVNHRRGLAFEPVLHDTHPIHEPLADLSPITLCLAERGMQQALWQTLVQGYHYLGFTTRVGKSLTYLALDRQERPVAALLFGAAAWKVSCRDQFIGWSIEQRGRNLARIANNMRFLIPPWVRVAHLASHVMALACRRISQDWQCKYGHGLALLETFVEQPRFAGTCYKAANWIDVGETTGRTRNDINHTISSPRKRVMLYPLRPDFREHLMEETEQ